MKNRLTTLAFGILFGLGLSVSQMINPEKVLAFLYVDGNWGPSLALVLVSGVSVTIVGFHCVMRQQRLLFEVKFYLSTRKDVDLLLIFGAAIFGVAGVLQVTVQGLQLKH